MYVLIHVFMKKDIYILPNMLPFLFLVGVDKYNKPPFLIHLILTSSCAT